MSDNRYRQVVRLVTESPWAIIPSKLEAILELVRLKASGESFSAEEIEARIGAGPSSKTVARVADVAVIPIYGSIMPKANLMTQISGGTSVQQFKSDYLAAMADADVGSIVLDVDSPGGMVDQIPEIAAVMRQNRGRKPVLAAANTLMASAAYWIGSQADEITISPSGLAGSIGVFAAHDDYSGMLEADGVKTTLISAGKYKTEGNPYEPLTDDARAHMQELVDAMYASFTLDVSKGRGVPVDDVRNGYGEGRVLDAKAAVKAGLADRVATLEDTIAKAAQMAAERAPKRQRAALAASDPPIPPDPEDVPPEAAESGLSFAAKARFALDATRDLVDAARGFADVRERDRLTAAKREQLAALTEALRDLGQARDSLVALLDQTDPTRPLREAQEAAARYAARQAKERMSR